MSSVKLAGFASAFALAIGVASFPSVSKADTYVFSGGATGCQFSCGSPSGNIVNVTVTDIGANEVSVSAVLTSTSYSFVGGGIDATLAYNLIGSFTIGQSNYTNFAPITLTAVTAPHMDGLTPGQTTFDFGVENPTNGFAGALGQSLSFDLTASGLTAASFLEKVGSWYMGVDLAFCGATTNCNTATSALATGALGLSTVTQVPLPPAVLLFGTALVGMGILGRRRRNDRLAQA